MIEFWPGLFRDITLDVAPGNVPEDEDAEADDAAAVHHRETKEASKRKVYAN